MTGMAVAAACIGLGKCIPNGSGGLITSLLAVAGVGAADCVMNWLHNTQTFVRRFNSMRSSAFSFISDW